MSDQQRIDWEVFVAEQHAKGRCEFSGMRVDGKKCCGCYDSACCRESAQGGDHD